MNPSPGSVAEADAIRQLYADNEKYRGRYDLAQRDYHAATLAKPVATPAPQIDMRPRKYSQGSESEARDIHAYAAARRLPYELAAKLYRQQYCLAPATTIRYSQPPEEEQTKDNSMYRKFQVLMRRYLADAKRGKTDISVEDIRKICRDMGAESLAG